MAIRQLYLNGNHTLETLGEVSRCSGANPTVDTLDMKAAIVNSGMIHFDFCTGYAPDCVFKEHCPCLKIWNESTDEDCSTEDPINENPK